MISQSTQKEWQLYDTRKYRTCTETCIVLKLSLLFQDILLLPLPLCFSPSFSPNLCQYLMIILMKNYPYQIIWLCMTIVWHVLNTLPLLQHEVPHIRENPSWTSPWVLYTGCSSSQTALERLPSTDSFQTPRNRLLQQGSGTGSEVLPRKLRIIHIKIEQNCTK